MKSPFPYFGGKSRVASEVWRRLGNPDHYVEPFFGSGAVLLARPDAPRVETVNDWDCLLANLWRAIKADPAGVVALCDYPVIEADLHVRHDWLVNNRERVRSVVTADPFAYDLQAAAWWLWGAGMWIGGGWCDAEAGTRTHRRLPQIASPSCAGIHPALFNGTAAEWISALSERLRRVRICNGDWARVVTPTVLDKHKSDAWTTAVFLDPPYTLGIRGSAIYASDASGVCIADDVRRWAIENGSNPRLRIALCGYEGEHEMPEDWAVFAWSASGRKARGNHGPSASNRHLERIWFSPHCLTPGVPDMFDASEGEE
jgi:DNA adenine methylase